MEGYLMRRHAVLFITLLLFTVACAGESAPPTLPSFDFGSLDNEDTESSEEGSENTEEEGGEASDEGGDQDAGDTESPQETDGDATEASDDTDTEESEEEGGDTEEEPDDTSDPDTESTDEGGETEEGGENGETPVVDLCDFVEPPNTIKNGVCKTILKCNCEDGEYDCNYALVPNYEPYETLCDGLDNDCDGAVDEGLVDINDSTCSNEGVCKNSVFAFCHQGTWHCDYGLAPSFEFSETLCDGLDNDCDGQTDESVSFDSITCKSEGVCQGNAQPVCAEGGIQCDYTGAGILYQEVETRCDNLDNDCDGVVDEFEVTGLTGEDCDPGAPQFSPCCAAEGVCSGKTKAYCSGGAWSCDWSGVSEYEVEETLCDGKDTDCDGEVDEAEHLEPSTSDCPQVGVCSAATPFCDVESGSWDCNLTAIDGYEADNEVTCDNQDNDCDGEVDDGIVAPQGPETTICPEEGVCVLGVQTTCSEGIWKCDFEAVPDYEDPETSCDTQDNDCDGEIDEALTAPTGEAEGCEQFGEGVCTQFVTLSCEDGLFVCSYDNVPLFEEEETLCDGLDNDCDGEIDENLTDPLLSECLHVGVCAVGTVASCQNKEWFCFYNGVQDFESVEVTCDNQDNDCDGEVDEGLTDPLASSCKSEGVCAQNVQAGCMAGNWLCDYSTVEFYSGEEEYTCDGLDNDCDGTADEFVCETGEPCTEDIQCAGNKCRALPGSSDKFCTEGTKCVLPLESEDGVELVVSGSTACVNDSTYQTCVAGTWTNTYPCPEESPVCDQGQCLSCAPTSLDCASATERVSCGFLGEGFEPTSGCAGDAICVGPGACVSPVPVSAGGISVAGGRETPYVIGLIDDGFMIGWTDLGGSDSDGAGFYDRKYISNGNGQGLESLVNAVKVGDQNTPTAIGIDDIAITSWMDYSESTNARILTRSVTSIGDPDSPVTTVSPEDGQHHANPEMALLASGDFVIVWESGPTPASQNTDILARLYNGDGSAKTDAFSVNSVKTGQQTRPDVVALADGRFIVAWESHESGDGQILFQRFKSDGSKQGSGITVNQSAGGDQSNPSMVVLATGKIAFVYETDLGVENGDRDVLIRLFSSGGLGDGAEFSVLNDGAGDQYDPAVTSLHNSGFAVAFVSEGSATDVGIDVQMVRYTNTKDVIEAAQSVASDNTGDQGQPALHGFKDGRVVAAWQDQQEEQESTILFQIFEFNYGELTLIP